MTITLIATLAARETLAAAAGPDRDGATARPWISPPGDSDAAPFQWSDDVPPPSVRL